jgi:hypothetical protein
LSTEERESMLNSVDDNAAFGASRVTGSNSTMDNPLGGLVLLGQSFRGAAVALAIIGLVIASDLSAPPALAALGINPPSPMLTDSETQIVEENPALRELSSLSPKLLRQALDIITRARSRQGSGRGSLLPLDENDVRLLDQNPILRDVLHSSPEASADLLQLLKTAGGSGKPQK